MFLHNKYWKKAIYRPGPEVIKLFSCSTQLITQFILLINVKMPTIVGILTFIGIIYFYNLGANCAKLFQIRPVGFARFIFNSLHAGYFFMHLLSSDFFSKLTFFKYFFQEQYQSVKQFGSRSGPTFCRS